MLVPVSIRLVLNKKIS